MNPAEPAGPPRGGRSDRTTGRQPRGMTMRYRHQAQQLHSVIPPALGRAMLHNVLAIAGALVLAVVALLAGLAAGTLPAPAQAQAPRSEEHTSELQSLMRNSYAVFCLKKTTT